MAVLTGLTSTGAAWTPKFLTAIDPKTCLGCGRCFKVCGRNVMALKPMNDEGEFVEDEDEDEVERKVMTLANPENCIGCEACSRICPKNCHSHATAELN